MTRYTWIVVCAIALLASGCSTVRDIVGFPTPGDPSVTLRSTDARWLLVKNPRFGDIPSEPEYIWVEEDKRPWTFRWLIPRRAPIAPPEVVARYGPPPGRGRISPRQALPTPTLAEPPRTAGATRAATRGGPEPTARGPEAKRGIVVWADTTRIVIDLTTADGVRPGTVISLRRDKIPIVHPVTGELLGELDEEVATARVVETREKFSVAELETVAPGAHVQVRDRVVLK